eukprot:CAMPEP_0206473954 /NCGR_PEP_ID=MMETSP0324_2-20121206/33189_1 /ASSEMBLY_ACC=CAM_ASM_000836 /TAXON_ID=2866 /ORGANISM="Crypthecodinium cohnii, Strain Seligo" /LENGTH=46 /DNA_ID= /DNA_START= /DNA_END= /DNA_ORIENTATION=
MAGNRPEDLYEAEVSSADDLLSAKNSTSRSGSNGSRSNTSNNNNNN